MNDNERIQNYVKGLVSQVVKAFTDHHDDLEIQVTALGNILIIGIRAHASETPRIIGQQGRHVAALQTILGRVGKIIGRRIRLEIREAIKGEKSKLLPYRPNPDWTPGPMTELLRLLLAATTGDTDVEIALERANGAAMFRLDATSRAMTTLDNDPELVTALDRILVAIGRQQGQQVFLEAATLIEP